MKLNESAEVEVESSSTSSFVCQKLFVERSDLEDLDSISIVREVLLSSFTFKLSDSIFSLSGRLGSTVASALTVVIKNRNNRNSFMIGFNIKIELGTSKYTKQIE